MAWHPHYTIHGVTQEPSVGFRAIDHDTEIKAGLQKKKSDVKEEKRQITKKKRAQNKTGWTHLDG